MMISVGDVVVHHGIRHTERLKVIRVSDWKALLEYPDGMRLWQRTEDLRVVS